MEKIGLQAVFEMAGFQSAMSNYLSGVDKMGSESDNAAHKATSAFDRIGGAIAGVGKAAAAFTLAAVVGGVAALTGALVSSVKAAAEAQVVEAQLDAVLKSTGASSEKAAAEYEAASKTIVTSTKLSAAEIGKLSGDLETMRLKHSTLGAEIQEQKERVRQLTAQWGDNGLATIKAKNKLAEMENQFKTGGSAIDALTRALKDGAIPTTTTLAQKLGLTAPAARMTKDELIKLADSLMNVTRFEDEAIIGAESLLLTFTSIGKDIFPLATETVLDMSQALGQDLKSSAIQLGKALNDPITGITALRRVGVQFTDAQEAMIKKLVESGDTMGAQKLILQELQTEFGGSARAAGKTFAGQLDILKNKLGNIQEIIGGAILPVLQQFADTLINVLSSPAVVGAIDAVVGAIGRVREIVEAVIRVFQGAPGAVLGLQVAFSNLTGISIEDIDKWWKKIGDAVDFVVEKFGIVKAWVSEHWPAIHKTITDVWDKVKTKVHDVLADVVPFATEKFGVVKAWVDENWPKVKDTLTNVWEGFKTKVHDVLGDVEPFITEKLGIAKTWIETNWPLVKETLSNVWEGFKVKVHNVLEDIEPFIAEKLSIVKTWIETNWPLVKDILANVWEGFQTKVHEVLDGAMPYISEKLLALRVWLDENWTPVKTVLTAVWDEFRAAADVALDHILPYTIEKLGALHAWLIENWSPVEDTLVKPWKGYDESSKSILPEVSLFAIAQFSKVAAWVDANWPLIEKTINKVLDRIKSDVETALKIISWLWKSNGDDQGNIVKYAWDIIKTEIGAAVDYFLNYLKLGMQLFTGDWAGAWETAKTMVSDVWEAIKTVVEDAFKIVLEILGRAYLPLKDDWEVAWTWIQDKAKEIWDAITKAADTWATGLETAADTMLDKIQTAIETVWGDIKTWLTNTWANITTMFAQGFADMVAKGLQFGKDVMNAIKDGILAIKLPIPTFRIEWVEGPFGIQIPDIVVGVRWASVGSLLGAAGVETGAGGGGGGGGANAAKMSMPAVSMQAQELRIPMFTVAGDAGVGAGITGILDSLRKVIEQMTAFANEYKDKGVEAAASIMSAIEQIISPLKTAIDTMAALGAYVGGADVKSAIHALILDLQTVVWQLVGFAGDFELKAVEAAGLIMTAIGQMLAPIKAATDALKAIGEYVGISDMKGAVHTFLLDLGAVVTQINMFAGDFDLTTTEAAGKLMTAIGQIMAPMKAVVDGLNAIATYVHSTNLIAGWLSAKDDLRFVVNWMVTAKDWFGVEAVAAAAVFATGVGQIMAPMKAVVDGLTTIATYVHGANLIGAWMAMKDDMRFVVNWMVTAKDWFGAEAVAAAGAFSASVGQIMAPMKSLVDGLTAIATYVHGANLIGAWLAIKTDLQFVLGWMVELAKLYEIEGVKAAAAFGASVGAMLAPMKSVVDGLTAIATYMHGKNLIGAWFAIKADLQFVLGWMLELARIYKDQGVAAAAAFGASVGAMLAPMKSVVDGLTAIATYVHGKNLIGAWFAIKADLQFVLGWMLELAKTYEITGVEAAAAFSAAVGAMMAPVKTAVDALTAIGTYARAKGMTAALQAFRDDLVLVVQMMIEATSVFDAKAVAAAAAFAAAAGVVFGMIKTALDALSAIAEFGSAFITPAKIEVMADMIRYLTEMIAWLSYQVAPVAVAAAVAFSEQASVIFEFMKKALDFLGALATTALPQKPKIDAFLEALWYILEKFREGLKVSEGIAKTALGIFANLNLAGFDMPAIKKIIPHPIPRLPWDDIPGRPKPPSGGGGGGGSGSTTDIVDVLKRIEISVDKIYVAMTSQNVPPRVTPPAGVIGNYNTQTIQYNLTAQYRTMESESQLRDTVRMMEMAGAY